MGIQGIRSSDNFHGSFQNKGWRKKWLRSGTYIQWMVYSHEIKLNCQMLQENKIIRNHYIKQIVLDLDKYYMFSLTQELNLNIHIKYCFLMTVTQTCKMCVSMPTTIRSYWNDFVCCLFLPCWVTLSFSSYCLGYWSLAFWLLEFLSLPLYSLFLQNFSRAFPWEGEEERNPQTSNAFVGPSFHSWLTGPLCHSLGSGSTDLTLYTSSGEDPWHGKPHRIHIILDSVCSPYGLTLSERWDPTDPGFSEPTALTGSLWNAVSQGSRPSPHSNNTSLSTSQRFTYYNPHLQSSKSSETNHTSNCMVLAPSRWLANNYWIISV